MASRLSHPAVIGALALGKGITGALVSEQDRQRALGEKEAERSAQFNQSLALMGIKQQMDLASSQQTDMSAINRAKAIRQNEIANPIPPTAEEQARTGMYNANAAGVETPEERASREQANRKAQAEAQMQEQVERTRQSVETTAMMAPDANDGIDLIRQNTDLLGKPRADRAMTLLKEKAKREDHERNVEKARSILVNPKNDLDDDARKKIAKGFGLTDAELYEMTGTETMAASAVPWATPASSGGYPGLGGPTNTQEAQDFQRQGPTDAALMEQAGAAPPAAPRMPVVAAGTDTTALARQRLQGKINPKTGKRFTPQEIEDYIATGGK